MRKSLGSKRNEISTTDIEEIARIYGEFKDGEYCKIFDNKEFGYLKVTVERPLKLNFQISEERIENLYAESAFSKLYDEDKVAELELKKEKLTIKKKEETDLGKQYKGKVIQDNILDTLRDNVSEEIVKSREEFDKKLKAILSGLDLSNTLYKAVLMSLSERDETADYCMKGKKKEPDSTLRDTETIPLSLDVESFEVETDKHITKEKRNILAYIDKEVKPHISEFWLDESKTKIGYEIPFTRYFYKYEELRPFKDIMAEIEVLEKEIQSEIKKVIG